MKKLLSLSILTLITLLLGACAQQNPSTPDDRFVNNSKVLGRWVHFNLDNTIASSIEFSTSQFTDENGNVTPFRIDSQNRLFIQGANNVESQIAYTLDGDYLTFNGVEYIKANSPTYDQKTSGNHNSQGAQNTPAPTPSPPESGQSDQEHRDWNQQVAAITQELQSTYNQANNRINQGVFNFVNGHWHGDTDNEPYTFYFGGSNGSGTFSMTVQDGNTQRSFDGCFLINPTTYKISPFVSYGKINNDFYIGYHDYNKLNQVKDNISYMNNLTFEDFIRNSTLYLPTNLQVKTKGVTNTILVKNCGNDNNPAKIVINNLNTDTNQMLITNGPGMRNEGRLRILNR